MDAVREPLIVRPWPKAGVEGEVGCALPPSKARMDKRGRDEKYRIAKGHRLWVEISEEIPEEWMADNPLSPHAADEGNAIRSAVWNEPHRRLHLEGQGLTELSAGVDLLVAAIVIRVRCRDFEFAAAAHHHQLGGLKLADNSLLDLRQAHVAFTLAGSVSGCPSPAFENGVDRRCVGIARFLTAVGFLDRNGVRTSR